MAYNGSGVFSLYTPGNPVVTGTTISSTWANNTLTDIATGLSTAICKDGQTTTTAIIPFVSGVRAGSDSSGNAPFIANASGAAGGGGSYAIQVAGAYKSSFGAFAAVTGSGSDQSASLTS